jgi:hypothetical protein
MNDMNTNTNGTVETKQAAVAALAKWLGEDAGNFEEARFDCYGLTVVEIGRDSYAIGADEEVDEACENHIRDNLWAFNAEFITDCCGLPRELADALRAWQQKECERANEGMLALIDRCDAWNRIVGRAVSLDGRGHFLASYDGDEIDLGGGLFAYRIG